MAMVNPLLNIANANVKDSRWLTLEVCREFQRNKCTREDTECKFAHPPPHVEVQNGRVTACFDSIKGKCQRKEPPCKYLHPPQHLREQLLQNGRNNLILKNLQMQAAQAAALSQPIVPGLIPVSTNLYSSQVPMYSTARPEMYEAGSTKTTAMALPAVLSAGQYPMLAHPYIGGTQPSAVTFNPYISAGMQTTIAVPNAQTNGETPSMSHQTGVIPTQIPNATATKVTRPDRLEPQVVEVLTGKKRPRDPSDDIVLTQNPLGGVMGQYKRIAFADAKGLPVYQPNANVLSYQQAIAMQLQQPQYVPVTFAGHPPSVPRF